MALDLDRMRGYAAAADTHPTWSIAYAQDVPALILAVEDLRTALAFYAAPHNWKPRHIRTLGADQPNAGAQTWEVSNAEADAGQLAREALGTV